jgi:peptidyl-prolyl cis-trans isomerase B (cyclophilin B)
MNPIATILMSSGREIKIEIYPDIAPNTANSFIYLAQKGCFDQKPIRRIVKDFVIQPSYNSFENDPECDFLIEGEFNVNGFNNALKLDKYAVAMGGDGEHYASGSCFFIVVGDNIKRLAGKYPGFGKVISGFEEIDRLLDVETFAVEADAPGVVINEPKKPEIMLKVSVETFGKVFEAPVKIKEQV